MNNNKKEKIMKYAIVASTIFTLSVLTLALAKPQTAAATTTATITSSQPDSIVSGKTTFLPWYGDGGVITFLPYYANNHGDGITLIPQTQPMSDLSGV